MSREFRSDILPQDFRLWHFRNAYLDPRGNVVIKPEGYIQYTIQHRTDEERFNSAAYRVNSVLHGGFPQDPYNPSLSMHVSFETVDPIEYTYTDMFINITPYIGNEVMFDVESPGGTCDNIIVTITNRDYDRDITVANIHMYPSYDLDANIGSLIDQRMPAVIHKTNTHPITIDSSTRVVMDLDFNVGSSAAAHGTVCLSINSTSHSTVTARVDLNTETLLPAAVRSTLTNGWNTMMLPFYAARTTAGPNKLELLLSSSAGEAINIGDATILLDTKNIVGSGGLSPSDLRVVDRFTCKAVPIDLSACGTEEMLPLYKLSVTEYLSAQCTVSHNGHETYNIELMEV